MQEDLRSHLLKTLETRVGAIEKAVEEVLEKRLFVPVAPWTNSLGNLVLHVSGNLRTFVGKIGGKLEYERDRDGEFNESSLSADELLETLRVATDVSRSVLSAMDEDLWQEVPEEPLLEGSSRGEHVLHSLDHLSYHSGQIVLIGKILALLSKE